jgi:hypothetical protein
LGMWNKYDGGGLVEETDNKEADKLLSIN